MARKLPLHPHLPAPELSRRARQAPNLVEARRWHLLTLVADGKTVKAAAALVGLNVYYARRVVRRYNRQGPASLRDRRLEQTPPVRPPLLSAEQQQELAEAVQGPAPGGGLWTGPDVARWIAAKTGREHVAPQRGHDYLRRVGMSPQRPRPRHTDADPAAQDAFKKNLDDEVAAIRAAHAGADVQLWATDEHRHPHAGTRLLPLIRRVWAPVGKRPIAPVQQRYEWLYVCGFVRPTTGETEWWLLPTVTAVVFGLILEAFARDVGAGPTKRILLVLDGAGWHTGEEVHVPEGIHLLVLPSYSPELQPAEHLWPLTNEPLANVRFADLATLEEVQAKRCLTLQQQPDLIRQHTLFRWWPTDA